MWSIQLNTTKLQIITIANNILQPANLAGHSLSRKFALQKKLENNHKKMNAFEPGYRHRSGYLLHKNAIFIEQHNNLKQRP